jgi:hypothetical protein
MCYLFNLVLDSSTPKHLSRTQHESPKRGLALGTFLQSQIDRAAALWS